MTAPVATPVPHGTWGGDELRSEALDAFTAALKRLLELGIAPFTAQEKEQLAANVLRGCRIGFRVITDPLAVQCYVASADLSETVELFRIDTSRLDLHQCH